MTDYNYSYLLVSAIAAGASQTFNDVNFDWIFAEAIGNQGCGIAFDNEAAQTIRQGTGLQRPFTSVAVTNQSLTLTLTARFFAGKGIMPHFATQMQRNRLSDVPDVVCAPGAQTQLIVTPFFQSQAVWLSIPAGEANGLRIGGTNSVAANRGLYLPVGVQPIRLTGSSTLYAFNPGAGNVTITLANENPVTVS